jgi:lysine 2,3-aminomutase
MRNYYEIPLWKDISLDQWRDWHWQLQNVITEPDDLAQVINLSSSELQGIREATRYVKLRISPHIVSLMDPSDRQDTLRLQFVPSRKEVDSIENPNLFPDVNADYRYVPKGVNGLVHRYPTKVLILPTNYCGAYCRYCFRRKFIREVETSLSKTEFERAFNYIQERKDIEEVILSGGDPLVLGDETINYIVQSIAKIPHVKIFRIHTRMPVTVPYRITQDLIKILNQFKPTYMVIHIDTAREISDPMRDAIAQLVDNGIPCLASCPLLKDINDNEATLKELWTELVRLRVKPYYLFHSDPVQGLRHFLVSIEKGLEIMRNLYDRMSGLAMPLYCFNVPDGGGHVLLTHSYVRMVRKGHYRITTFEGKAFDYFEDLEEQ